MTPEQEIARFMAREAVREAEAVARSASLLAAVIRVIRLVRP